MYYVNMILEQYVCMYVRIYVCMYYVNMILEQYVCMYVCMYVYMYVLRKYDA